MIKKIDNVTIYHNDLLVGKIVENDNENMMFQYSEEWIKNGFPISPFSLPLENKIFTQTKNIFDGVIGVFIDSLPGGWARHVINKQLKEFSINYENLNTPTQLSLLDKYSLGSLTFKPNQSLKTKIFKLTKNNVNELDTLFGETNKIKDTNNVSSNDSFYLLSNSVGGARPKTNIIIDNQLWIIKFQGNNDPKDVGLREYNINLLAEKCGLELPEYKLIKTNNNSYFATKRFDRTIDNKSIHVISLSAILETSIASKLIDYVHLFQVIQSICEDQNDLYKAYRQMCFNVLANNKDDHAKNWSFMWDEEIDGYKLTPSYDLTSEPNKLEHEMSVDGNFNPNKQDLLDMIDKMDLNKNKCLKILDEVENTIKNNQELLMLDNQ